MTKLLLTLFEKLLLLAFGLLLSLFFFELGFRMYFFSTTSGDSLASQLEQSEKTLPKSGEENVSLSGLIRPSRFKDVVYELKQNFTGRFQGKLVTTNRWGMRDRDYEKEKAKGTYRIVGLGDSIMFGWGVADGESYLDRIEEAIKRPGNAKIEVLNFGVPGYNTAMEVSLFDHVVKDFKPDLVIIQFVNNDFQVPAFMQPPKDYFSLQRSFLLEFIKARTGKKAAALIGTEITKLPERQKVIEQYRWMIGSGGYERAMDRLAAMTTAKGIPVLIVSGKASSQQRKIMRNVAKKHRFQRMKVGPFVEKYLSEKGLAALTAAERRKLLTVSPADSHPNALGHQIYADAIMERLRKMRIPQIAVR